MLQDSFYKNNSQRWPKKKGTINGGLWYKINESINLSLRNLSTNWNFLWNIKASFNWEWGRLGYKPHATKQGGRLG